MSAGQFDFADTNAIEQGATFDRTLVFKDGSGDPVDLTGFTARMQVRPSIKSNTVLLELTTANSRIVITPLTGTIRLLVSADDTADLDFNQAVYDLEIESGAGTVTRLVEGAVELSKEVTR